MVAEARIVIKMFLFWAKIEARSYFKKACSLRPPSEVYEVTTSYLPRQGQATLEQSARSQHLPARFTRVQDRRNTTSTAIVYVALP